MKHYWYRNSREVVNAWHCFEDGQPSEIKMAVCGYETPITSQGEHCETVPSGDSVCVLCYARSQGYEEREKEEPVKDITVKSSGETAYSSYRITDENGDALSNDVFRHYEQAELEATGLLKSEGELDLVCVSRTVALFRKSVDIVKDRVEDHPEQGPEDNEDA